MKRRLTAILAMDVVGYSRLIGADETGTLTILPPFKEDMIQPTLKHHRGRVFKLMSDGLLAEFENVVDTVRAAVETQQAVAKHNATGPEDKRIELRVGVSLDDVVFDGDDIHGDGVNVAERLKGSAEPGGICISDIVYEGVRNRIDFLFEDFGEQEFENTLHPVRVWQYRPGADATDGVPETLPLNNCEGPDYQTWERERSTQRITKKIRL